MYVQYRPLTAKSTTSGSLCYSAASSRRLLLVAAARTAMQPLDVVNQREISAPLIVNEIEVIRMWDSKVQMPYKRSGPLPATTTCVQTVEIMVYPFVMA